MQRQFSGKEPPPVIFIFQVAGSEGQEDCKLNFCHDVRLGGMDDYENVNQMEVGLWRDDFLASFGDKTSGLALPILWYDQSNIYELNNFC